MFNWGLRQDKKAVNAIILGEGSEKGRPFKARFLQAGLVKYDFGVCLLQKETIDKFIDTFKGCPVIINHKDNITEADKVGVIQNIWFSDKDGWYWCEGVLTDDKAVELVENGYNVSCQYAITDYSINNDSKLHNGNPYDKEILNGLFDHLAIVDNPRYEGAYIAVNAYIAQNAIARNDDEDVDWITVKGNHIPIKEGETKKEAVKKFIDKVREKKATKTTDIKEKKNTTSEKEKQISKEYALMRSKDFVKSIDENPKSQKEILFTNNDSTWLLVESWKKGEEGWDLVKGGKVIKHFNDRYEANDAWDKGYFDDIDAMDKQTAQNNIEKYQPVFDWIRNFKGGTMDKETKGLFESLIDALKARNEADAEKDKEEKEAENKKAKNEDVDKRDIIRQIMAIAGKREDDEDVRTIAKLAEKLAYDKSEAGTADNKAKNEDEEEGKDKDAENKCKNKCKNEDDGEKKEKEEKYEELKEEVKKEAENKKAKNSMDALKRVFFEGEAPRGKIYMSQKEGIELGRKLY